MEDLSTVLAARGEAALEASRYDVVEFHYSVDEAGSRRAVGMGGRGGRGHIRLVLRARDGGAIRAIEFWGVTLKAFPTFEEGGCWLIIDARRRQWESAQSLRVRIVGVDGDVGDLFDADSVREQSGGAEGL
jgi:hypothetical protein